VSEQDEGSKTPDKGEFTQDLKIEGVFLHIRAIIEQGRTEEFIKICKEAGYATLKAQDGLVRLAHDFILAGGGVKPLSSRPRISTEKLFEAIRRKNPDIC
jgi:hypothetical protein